MCFIAFIVMAVFLCTGIRTFFFRKTKFSSGIKRKTELFLSRAIKKNVAYYATALTNPLVIKQFCDECISRIAFFPLISAFIFLFYTIFSPTFFFSIFVIFATMFFSDYNLPNIFSELISTYFFFLYKFKHRDEHEPLNAMDCDSMKKPLSVEYDGRTVHSRSGDFVGKNSAV